MPFNLKRSQKRQRQGVEFNNVDVEFKKEGVKFNNHGVEFKNEDNKNNKKVLTDISEDGDEEDGEIINEPLE